MTPAPMTPTRSARFASNLRLIRNYWKSSLNPEIDGRRNPLPALVILSACRHRCGECSGTIQTRFDLRITCPARTYLAQSQLPDPITCRKKWVRSAKTSVRRAPAGALKRLDAHIGPTFLVAREVAPHSRQTCRCCRTLQKWRREFCVCATNQSGPQPHPGRTRLFAARCARLRLCVPIFRHPREGSDHDPHLSPVDDGRRCSATCACLISVGPVLFSAFRRLAAICLSEAMFSLCRFAEFSVNDLRRCCGEITGELLVTSLNLADNCHSSRLVRSNASIDCINMACARM